MKKRRAPSVISLRRFPVVVYLRDPHRHVAATSDRIGEGIVTDISRSSIGVTVDRPLSPGAVVVLVLNAEGPGERLLEATVLWTKAMPSSGNVLRGPNATNIESWRVGLRFDGAGSRDQRSFIEELLDSANTIQKYAMPESA
jgi:hypothetical protein